MVDSRACACSDRVLRGAHDAWAGVGVCTLAVLALAPSVASATAPGSNGEVTYVSQQTYLTPDSSGAMQPGAHYDIFAVPAAGGAPANLTMSCDDERDVDWSPSGRMVYAVDPISRLATMGPFAHGSQLWSVAGDGSDPRLVLDDTLEDSAPSWSPDGSRIAFERFSGANLDIYVVNSDGTNLSPFATGPDDERSPTWSPDGTRLAFARTTPSVGGQRPKGELWTANADGSGATRLYDVNPFLIGDLSGGLDWSPDGSRIAFTTTDGIHAAKADGSGIVPLVLDGARFAWGGPSFSPDGSKLAFGGGDLSDPPTVGVYTADLADLQPHLLINDPHGQPPDWAPATAHMVAAPPRTTCPNPFANSPAGGGGGGGGAGQPTQNPGKPLSVKFPKTMSIKRLSAGRQTLRVTTARAMRLRVTVSAGTRMMARRVGVRTGTVIGSSRTLAHAAGRVRVAVTVRRTVRAHLGRLLGTGIRVRIDGSANGKRLATARSRIQLVR